MEMECPHQNGLLYMVPGDRSWVCEDDVRQAMHADLRIVVNDRTIITPAARDLGEQHRVFVQTELPR